jgi:tetratricopeptide (TPR) repeat protein
VFDIMGSMQRMRIALGIFLLVVVSAVLVTPGARDQLFAFVWPQGAAPDNLPDQRPTPEEAGSETDSDRAKAELGPLTGGIADIPGLLEKLKDEDPPVREAAAKALAGIGKPAVPALSEALKHDEQRVRIGATRALVLLKGDAKGSIPALVDALDDQSSMVRFGAGRALESIGTDAIPALIQGLNGSKERVRYHSILALSKFGPKAKDGIPALAAALAMPAAAPASESLHRDDSGKVTRSEYERMRMQNFVRAAAADALGAMGAVAKPALPVILEAMNDKEPSVSNRAREAKMRIDPDDFERGILAMQSHDYEKAIRFFTKVLGANSGNQKYEWSPAQRESMTSQHKQIFEYLAQCHQALAESFLRDRNIRRAQEDFDRDRNIRRAQEHFEKWIQLRPNDATPLLERGGAYLGLHDYAKALADFKRASELLPKEASELLPKDPRLANCYNNIAWILATCPREGIRDGKEAIKYATEACKIQRIPIFVDTLAAAHAEAGNFEEAVKFQKEVLKGPGRFQLQLRDAPARLRLYESQKPYRQD